MRELRLLICGGRDYQDWQNVYATLDRIHRQFRIVRIVEGGAKGADQLGAEWAIDRGMILLLRSYPARWEEFGRSAGHRRNREMLDEEGPNAVVAFPGGPGTANMIVQAEARGIRVWRP